MKKWLVGLSLLLTGIMLFSPSRSFASGFALPEQSASAMGMASAFVAQADDASAVWYNPAAITRLDGAQMAAGLVAIYPSFKHEGALGTEAIERKLHLPIMLYGTNKISDTLSFGIGINNPFGLETNWSPVSTTSYVATLSQVKTLNVNPNIAYKISDNLSVAVGVDYLMLDATLARLGVLVEGDGDGYGGNASIFYKASDSLNLGFTYRSKIKADVDGTLNNLLSATTSIVLPDEYKIGASIKTSDATTLNVEADWTNWSTYNALELKIAGLPQPADPKEWQDTWCLRIGGQYKVNDQWKLRAGYLYDTNPVREEYFETRVPDSDRQGLTIGTGYTSGKTTVDASYLYLHFNERTITSSLADDFTVGSPVALNGNYKAQAHIASVMVGYKF